MEKTKFKFNRASLPSVRPSMVNKIKATKRKTFEITEEFSATTFKKPKSKQTRTSCPAQPKARHSKALEEIRKNFVASLKGRKQSNLKTTVETEFSDIFDYSDKPSSITKTDSKIYGNRAPPSYKTLHLLGKYPCN